MNSYVYYSLQYSPAPPSIPSALAPLYNYILHSITAPGLNLDPRPSPPWCVSDPTPARQPECPERIGNRRALLSITALWLVCTGCLEDVPLGAHRGAGTSPH